MRAMKFGPVALAIALAAGCAGSGVNTASVFPPQSGKIQLKVLTADTTVTEVEFVVDDKVVGTDKDGSDGWMVEFDTTSKADGIYTVRATGTSPAGPIELLNNSVLIKNGQTTAATPSPTASPSEAPAEEAPAEEAPTEPPVDDTTAE